MTKGLNALFLIIGFIAAAGDLVIPAILGKQYPDYSNIKSAISELGVRSSPVKKQASAWLISLGILFICFGTGQGFQFKEMHLFHWLYVLGIIGFGIGAGIIAGIFPEDPAGAQETITGKIHGICAGLGFILLIFNPLWALGIDELKGLQYFNFFFFILALLAFFLFLVSKKRKKGIWALTGLWQRISLIVLYTPLLTNFFGTRPL